MFTLSARPITLHKLKWKHAKCQTIWHLHLHFVLGFDNILKLSLMQDCQQQKIGFIALQKIRTCGHIRTFVRLCRGIVTNYFLWVWNRYCHQLCSKRVESYCHQLFSKSMENYSHRLFSKSVESYCHQLFSMSME